MRHGQNTHRNRKHTHSRRNTQRKHVKQRQSGASRTFYKFHRFIRRHSLISAVGAIVLSIILIRIWASNSIFGNNIGEFRMWFLFVAILIGIVGLFALKVWFRNNVSDFTSKHTVNWRKR